MTDESKCDACGVAWSEHLGLAGTCAELREALAEIERLRVALSAIMRHQETVGGGMAKMSAAYQIAAKALSVEV